MSSSQEQRQSHEQRRESLMEYFSRDIPIKTLPTKFSDFPFEWDESHPYLQTVSTRQKTSVALFFEKRQHVNKRFQIEGPRENESDLKVKPELVVGFKDVQLTKINRAIKLHEETDFGVDCVCANLRPLRNYLVTRKEERGKHGSPRFLALLFDKFPGKPTTENFLQVDINKSFARKITELYQNPAISVVLKVEGKFKDGLTSFCRAFKNEGEKVPVADLFTPGICGRMVLTHASETFGYPFGKQPTWKYSFILKVEVDNVRSYQIPRQTDDVFLKMYRMEDATKDFVLISENGARVRCHKIVLMAQCDSFAELLSNGHLLANAKEYELRNNSDEAVRLFVESIYFMENSLEQNIANNSSLGLELLLLANEYGCKNLERFMARYLGCKGMTYFSPDTILELYVSTEVPESLKELHTHCFLEMSTLPVESLRSCTYFQKASKTAQEILSQLLLKLQNKK